jgi:hypothetical protein
MLWRLTLWVIANVNNELGHPLPSVMLPLNLIHFLNRNLRCQCALLMKHFLWCFPWRCAETVPWHSILFLLRGPEHWMHFLWQNSETSQWCVHVSVRNSVVLVSTKAMSHDTLSLPSSRSVVCGFVCRAAVKAMETHWFAVEHLGLCCTFSGKAKNSMV